MKGLIIRLALWFNRFCSLLRAPASLMPDQSSSADFISASCGRTPISSRPAESSHGRVASINQSPEHRWVIYCISLQGADSGWPGQIDLSRDMWYLLWLEKMLIKQPSICGLRMYIRYRIYTAPL